MTLRGTGSFDLERSDDSVIEDKYICVGCEEEKPESAFQRVGKQRARSRFCKACTVALSLAAKRGKAAAAIRTASIPVPDTTTVQSPGVTTLTLLDTLTKARVDIMTLRDWLETNMERTAILCGADLFVRAGDTGIWVLRPDGSDVPEPIKPAVVLALAGAREGLVFW
jgi:hypothetical protein